jgi:AcrR family transcriptional regulator
VGNLHGFSVKDFASVPAYILDDEVTPQEEAILEARWHVMGAGKKQWPAFNQSAHIWAMHHRLGMPVAKIADVLGMSKPTVYKRLKAYEAMVEYQHKTQDEDLKKFSYFDEAYKSADVVKWLQDDESHLDDLIDWIHSDKFNRTGAKDMRELVKVLEDRPAREIFEKKDFNAAYIMFTKSNPEVDSSTFRIVKEAIDALQSIPRNEVQQVGTDPRRQEMLIELVTQANGVLAAAGIRKN